MYVIVGLDVWKNKKNIFYWIVRFEVEENEWKEKNFLLNQSYTTRNNNTNYIVLLLLVLKNV
jgi:hypothetical protein